MSAHRRVNSGAMCLTLCTTSTGRRNPATERGKATEVLVEDRQPTRPLLYRVDGGLRESVAEVLLSCGIGAHMEEDVIGPLGERRGKLDRVSHDPAPATSRR